MSKISKMRIIKGEFEGQMLHDGVVIGFWAIRNDLGLSASFEQTQSGKLYSELELFKTLEEIVYGEDSD